MTGNVTLAIVAGVLIAAGVYLLTERSLTRILVGVLVMSNGVNILFLIAAGPAGAPPILDMFPSHDMVDPLPLAALQQDRPALMPPLIKGYLRAGAWICGAPAWDPDFNTADLPILMPVTRIDDRYAKHFMGKQD